MTEIQEPTLEERTENAFNRRAEIFTSLDIERKNNKRLSQRLIKAQVEWADTYNLENTNFEATTEQVKELVNINKDTLKQFYIDSVGVTNPNDIPEQMWESVLQLDFTFKENDVLETLLGLDSLDWINVYQESLGNQIKNNKHINDQRTTDSITAENFEDAITDFKLLAEEKGFEYKQEPRTLQEVRSGYLKLSDKLYETNQPL